MKNFYEATVIKPNLKLVVALRIKPVGNIKARLQINDAKWITEITKEEVFEHQVGVTDPIDIQIQITRQHPEAFELALEIDGHTVLPVYQERAGVSTCYINTNDIWQLYIPNFYTWLHETTGQGWIS